MTDTDTRVTDFDIDVSGDCIIVTEKDTENESEVKEEETEVTEFHGDETPVETYYSTKNDIKVIEVEKDETSNTGPDSEGDAKEITEANIDAKASIIVTNVINDAVTTFEKEANMGIKEEHVNTGAKEDDMNTGAKEENVKVTGDKGDVPDIVTEIMTDVEDKASENYRQLTETEMTLNTPRAHRTRSDGKTFTISSTSLEITGLSSESDDDIEDDDDVFFSDEQPWDSSDEYDTDLDLPLDAKYPQSVSPRQNRDDVVCNETYVKACYKPLSKKTFPQRRIERELSERSLNLGYRSLGKDPIRPLSIALANNLRVERLDLHYTDLGSDGVKHLVQALTDNVTVTYLNLANNNIGTEGVKYVAYLLMKNQFIKQLVLEGNKLTDASAVHLALVLEHNSTLTYLDLSHNEFCDNGPKLLAAALGLNTGLERLNLSWNHVRGKGAVAICQSLKYNESLRSLDVSMCGFGYEGSLALAESLKVNTTLKELDMTSNRITWKGALLLASGLKVNTGLEIFKLGRNPLTTTGCMDITGAVSSPESQIKLLDLSHVPILIENEVLADAIRMRRDFQFVHGGVVMTPDVLGERKERKRDHMELLMDYLKASCIRPVEMLRDYDKAVNFNITQDDFVKRLVRTGIPLHKFEMRAMAKAIADNSRKAETDQIDYKKLVESVTLQILRDRIRVKRERFIIRKTKQHHKRILASGLPQIPYDRSQGQGKNSSRSSETLSVINVNALDLGTRSSMSLPSLAEASKGDNKDTFRSLLKMGDTQFKPMVGTRQPKKILMCAPLGSQGLKKKKTRKPTKKKTKRVKVHDHVETLVSRA